jgi:hypothetical protein
LFEKPDTDSSGSETPSQWTWHRGDDGVGALARYVSESSLEGIRALALRNAMQSRRSADDPASEDASVAGALYDLMLRLDLDPAYERWSAMKPVQRIRHPQLVIDDGVGNCLEFALMYAAMCLREHVAPLVAIVHGHAFVLLQLGRFVQEPSATPGAPEGEGWPRFTLDGAREIEPGVHHVTAANSAPLVDRVATGELVAVNAFDAAEGFSLAEAKGHASARLKDEWLTLVDVPWLHSQPATGPVAAPASLVTISPYIPGGEDFLIPYESRQAIERDLRDRSGVVVLKGASGSGKSVLARHLAITAAYGTGWFLNASRPQSLINSLAQADLARRDGDTLGKSDVDREEHAQAALIRLATAPHTWTVVLDNADGDPEKLLRFVPDATPGRRQLVIVTTTNPAWADQPGVELLELDPLSIAEAEQYLDRDDLIELADGRPLMIHAFAKLIGLVEAEALDAAVAAVRESDVESEFLAPSVLWTALLARDEMKEDARAFAVALALLPPDNQPLEALESLRPEALEHLRRFFEAGLIDFDEDEGVARVHRLFGKVIRDDVRVREPEAYRAEALRLARDSRAMALMETNGDLDTTSRLADALIEIDDETAEGNEALGEALHDVGRLLEFQGDTAASAAAYERAQRHLTEPLLIANCLQGRARRVNQRPPYLEPAVLEAIKWSQEAQQLIEENADHNQAGRTVAMRGLLLQKLAAIEGHEGEKPALLAEARELIEDAHQRRKAWPDTPIEELMRSEFNFGGIEINLAQVHRDNAPDYLQRAEDVYTTVAQRRREVYGIDIHPHIASCQSGLALVGYYRAVLIPASEIERSRWLREATENAAAALRQREVIDGSRDGGEIQKIAFRLVKVALARMVRAGAEDEDIAQVFNQARTELLAAPPRPGGDKQ